jgi:hypothetical protein
VLLRTSAKLAPRQELKVRTVVAVNDTVLTILANTPLLLEVVARGPAEWRSNFMHAHRGLAVNEGMADHLFRFFADHVVRRFGREHSANELLDAMEITVDRPPTQREIDESWEIESHSSEAGRRYFYGSDRPEDLVRRLMVN